MINPIDLVKATTSVKLNPIQNSSLEFSTTASTTTSANTTCNSTLEILITTSELNVSENIYKCIGNQNESCYGELGSQEQKTAAIIICSLSLVVIATNLVILGASKFASGGRSPTLIFVRSLCIADTVAGLFGVIKILYIFYGTGARINYFLGESLLITSFVASIAMVIGLTWECYVRLQKPLQHMDHIDKFSVLAVVAFVWDLSFVIGFIPQMGWNNAEKWRSKLFFEYYASSYLISLAAWYLMCLGILWTVHLILHRKLKLVTKSELGPEVTMVFSRQVSVKTKSARIMRMAHINVMVATLFYTPFILYMLLHSHGSLLYGTEWAETRLLYLYIVLLIKSLLIPIVNGIHTPQIVKILSNCCFNVLLGSYLRGHHDNFNVNDSKAENANDLKMKPKISMISKPQENLHARYASTASLQPARKASQALSTDTIETDISAAESNADFKTSTRDIKLAFDNNLSNTGPCILEESSHASAEALPDDTAQNVVVIHVDVHEETKL